MTHIVRLTFRNAVTVTLLPAGNELMDSDSRGASQVAQRVKNLPAMPGDLGVIPGSGRSSGGGNGYTLQYSCLENGQRSLAGYSPWGCKKSDMME